MKQKECASGVIRQCGRQNVDVAAGIMIVVVCFPLRSALAEVRRMDGTRSSGKSLVQTEMSSGWITSGSVLLGAFPNFAWSSVTTFHTLFHPSGADGVSSTISSNVWRTYRLMGRQNRSILDLAGPTAVVVVILVWTVLQAFGWAMVYWPFLPHEFRFAGGIPSWAQTRFVDALYVSTVTVFTLGFGDITPTTSWLRVLMPAEAMIGFALLTAGLSWVLSVYPVLQRRSSLMHRILIAAGSETGPADWLLKNPLLLDRVTHGLIDLRGDLMQFPITFYFRQGDPKAATPIALLTVLRAITSQPGGNGSERQQVRTALNDLTDYLGQRFLGGERSAERTLLMFIEQHGWSEHPQLVNPRF